MKISFTLILTLFFFSPLFAQKTKTHDFYSTDTLSFYSKAFNEDRTIYISTPIFYKYQSEKVKLPVIYILDGQHEWFVNPLINTITYLQYAHQIPQAIIVTIPFINRNREYGIKSLEGEELPLQKFITEEVDEKIQSYHPHNFKMIIGHSFSASFALYSYLKNPAYYSAVIANTPLDSFEKLILAFKNNKQIDKSKISISVGGKSERKDTIHRKEFDRLKTRYPVFFNSINTFVADNSLHNAVPIVANPYLISKVFTTMSKRFKKVVPTELTDEGDYKVIIKELVSVEDAISNIHRYSKLGNYFFPPDISEFNGIISDYLNSDLNDYGIAVIEMAIKYYPNYFDFHLQLYVLLLKTDTSRSKAHLDKAHELLISLETDLPVKQEVLDYINNERNKNGW
jgi:predicted alpha/beta superfamily hydrolase